MDVKIGDVYIRNSDGKICRVKMIDNIRIVLVLEDGHMQVLTDIFGLEKSYTKKESVQ